MHALFVLDEAKDEVAFPEGATAHAATVIMAEALLADGGPGECEFSILVEEIDSVLTGELVLFFRVVDDAWRVVVDVRGHDGLRPVDQEEGVYPVDMLGVVRMPQRT